MCIARVFSFFFYNIYDSLFDLNVYYYLLSGSQSNSRINYKRTYMYEATTDTHMLPKSRYICCVYASIQIHYHK